MARLAFWILFACTYGVLSTCSSAQLFAETLPQSYRINELMQQTKAGWGEKKTEGTHQYRVAYPGREALIRIPAWWNGSPRPPQGEIYAIEITYKDVASSPIVFTSFANVSSYDRNSEVHRFGGTNDGKWKTATVPVGWDLIVLRQGLQDPEFGIQSSAPTPISKIVVRKARLPEDKIRFEQETRDWVAGVQKQKRAAAGYRTPDETAVLPDSAKEKPLIPYVRPYTQTIFPNSAPQAGEAGRGIYLQMSQNEYEPGRFAVYAQQDLQDVTFTVSDLIGSSGKLNCNIDTFSVEYALSAASRGKAPYFLAQRFWDAYPTSIKKGQSHWFQIDVQTLGAKSKPGTYKGHVTIRSGNHTEQLPLVVQVFPFELLTMKEAKLWLGGCTSGKITPGEMTMLHEHNHNMVNLWYTNVSPKMTINNGKLKLDFHYFDLWMKEARERGIERVVYFIGSNPSWFPRCLALETEIYGKLGLGNKKKYIRVAGSKEHRTEMLPEVQPYYREWIRQLYDHAKQNNWPQIIVTPFDEPVKWVYEKPDSGPNGEIGRGPWLKPYFKSACKLIHDAHPDARIYISMHHNYYRNVHGYRGRVGELYIEDVDVVNTNAIGEDADLGKKILAKNREFWQYGGASRARFVYGYYFGCYRSKGSLIWAYNWGGLYDTSQQTTWRYGSYTPFGTVRMPEAFEIREGYDERRYIETALQLSKKTNGDFAAVLDEITQQAHAKGANGNKLVDGFWAPSVPGTEMDQWRRRIAEEIIKMNSAAE